MKSLIYIIVALLLCSFTVEEETVAHIEAHIKNFEHRIDSVMPRIKELTGLPAYVFLGSKFSEILVSDTCFSKAFIISSKGKSKRVKPKALRFMEEIFSNARNDVYTGAAISPTVYSQSYRVVFFAMCDSTGEIKYPFLDAIDFTPETDKREGLCLIWLCALCGNYDR